MCYQSERENKGAQPPCCSQKAAKVMTLNTENRHSYALSAGHRAQKAPKLTLQV